MLCVRFSEHCSERVKDKKLFKKKIHNLMFNMEEGTRNRNLKTTGWLFMSNLLLIVFNAKIKMRTLSKNYIWRDFCNWLFFLSLVQWCHTHSMQLGSSHLTTRFLPTIRTHWICNLTDFILLKHVLVKIKQNMCNNSKIEKVPNYVHHNFTKFNSSIIIEACY